MALRRATSARDAAERNRGVDHDFQISGSPASSELSPAGRLRRVPISEIVIGNNPRKTFSEESITELATTISQYGLLQPIVLLPAGKDGRYPLVAGERRIRAHIKNGEESIDAIIKRVDELSADDVDGARIVENVQREQVPKHEVAQAVAVIVERHSQVEAARMMGKSKTWVTFKVAHAKLVEEDRRAEKLDSQAAYQIFKAGDTPAARRKHLSSALSAGSQIRDAAANPKAGHAASAAGASSDQEVDKVMREIERFEARMRKLLSGVRRRAPYATRVQKLAALIRSGFDSKR